jgi:hypothetical protein
MRQKRRSEDFRQRMFKENKNMGQDKTSSPRKGGRGGSRRDVG